MLERAEIPTLDEVRVHRHAILRVAQHRGTHNVRVFGSVARGDAGINSDVDFLVEMEPGRSALDVSELILDLQEALGRRVDVVEARHPSALSEQVLSGAVAL